MNLRLFRALRTLAELTPPPPNTWGRGVDIINHVQNHVVPAYNEMSATAPDVSVTSSGDAEKWLLDLMGEWDFSIPTAAFALIIRRLAAVAPAGMDAVFTADEVAEAMEVLRGRHGSTALLDEALDDMERVLLAAAPTPPATARLAASPAATDSTATDLTIARLRNEVRMLNRSLCRKNRKLKGQYDALHRAQLVPMDERLKIVQRGPWDTEHQMVVECFRANRDGVTVVVKQPPAMFTSLTGGGPIARAYAYGFQFNVTDFGDDEPAIYIPWAGTLGKVYFRMTLWDVTSIEQQEDGSRRASIFSAGFEPMRVTIPSEVFPS